MSWNTETDNPSVKSGSNFFIATAAEVAAKIGLNNEIVIFDKIKAFGDRFVRMSYQRS